MFQISKLLLSKNLALWSNTLPSCRSTGLFFSTNEGESRKNKILSSESESDSESDSKKQQDTQQQVIEEDFYNYEKIKVLKDEEDIRNPFIFKTKYGYVKLVASPVPHHILDKIEGAHYFKNNVSTNYIRKIIKNDKKCLMVFDPDTYFKNADTLLKSTVKMLEKTYFGSEKKIKNPFAKCKTPKEIFNLHRRILMEMKSIINRLVIILNYDGSVRLKGFNPNTSLLKPHLQKIYKKISYQKHDFMVPLNIFQGMVAAENLEKEGIPIKILNNKKIYNFFGVWSPTKQTYLELFNVFCEKKKGVLKNYKCGIDLGCGTGVLGLALLVKGFGGKMYGIDKNENAAKASRVNSQLWDLGEKYRAECVDVDEAGKDKKTLEKIGFPQKYDLIVANPPWIVASYLNKDNELDFGVYDPEEKFLKNVFLFAKKHLSSGGGTLKKGSLLLIYSDISQNLGLQEKDRIKALCLENNLIIVDSYHRDFEEDLGMTMKIDPLIKFKSESKIIFYEIMKN